jgi:predicted ATPase/transcriptional regulator with XRE-family HTH domain
VVTDASREFGDLLREHRRAAGLTQEELAELAGVSPRSISELERGGAHVPRRDTIGLLAGALGLDRTSRTAFEALAEHRRRARPPNDARRPRVNVAPSQMSDAGQHNLPRSLTSFVGRERELSELGVLLHSAPLLTLVGAGGIGKTRLAHELVRAHASRYADGGWVVEVSELADAALLPGAVAEAIGLHDLHTRNLTGMLASYLERKQLLLVLDNCEHLIDACAELVVVLLRACPGLQVLATSREPLSIPGEITSLVLPLELATATRLFVERATAANHDLAFSDQGQEAIARICVAVDGIPLALELAAARTRMLTIYQIAERLDHDGALLATTSRGGPQQHRTIRATIDWSHDLLAEQEQVLLRRLAVFAGGWSLAMAEQVCTGGGISSPSVLELLAQLVEKSMVLVDTQDGVGRYRLLEPIRQYALDRLEASGEGNAFRARHAAAMLTLARSGPEHPQGADEIRALDRVAAEHANVRLALRWTMAHQQTEEALRTSTALFRFWERRGHFQEGCAWLEQALALPDVDKVPVRVHIGALNALAFLYWRGGESDRATPVATQALAASRADGHTRGVAQALLNLGMAAYLQHDYETAITCLDESVPMARQSEALPLLSVALTFLGRTLFWVRGASDPRVLSVLEESLALAERIHSRYAAGHALATLGDVRWAQGDEPRAVELWRRALGVVCELEDRRGIAGCLERLALVLARRGRAEEAAWLLGAAEAQHTALGIVRREDDEVDHAHFVAASEQRSVAAAGAVAWEAGQAATLAASIQRGLEVR